MEDEHGSCVKCHGDWLGVGVAEGVGYRQHGSVAVDVGSAHVRSELPGLGPGLRELDRAEYRRNGVMHGYPQEMPDSPSGRAPNLALGYKGISNLSFDSSLILDSTLDGFWKRAPDILCGKLIVSKCSKPYRT